MSQAMDVTPTPTQTQTAEQKATAYFELAVSLYLWRWPALSLAVENEWGGPDSAEKRDWLAGVVADLFSGTGQADEEDVEDVVTQVLSDEFSVALEDDSAYEVAVAIVAAFRDCQQARFEKIEALKVHFQNARPRATVSRAEGDGESDSSGTDAEVDPEEPAVGTGGEAMEVDAPGRAEPVVDEDGFELVQSKGKKGRR
ncbi:Pre-rRNA-processing protein TSR2 [Taphrina deformans PYCC 5710]|uniref:Pre-rRNA-processing protein TSR2 n=1 Tax=Taphrina deformans (strain PYCC 5710 / ATCC 11124 / CBS 356.35 / IMI 108563 / JCM 9778 / NBRC 8474) TaxID=1097556 RepID=R4X7P3_TAPDE|nr:Pre-rRNA-processing protein TSR2 [Taphrina deformans PYCC 5710]|eukprot:CCG81183.1 Pre-rRNA-processing protein TSR2 [Taphrina deformans PYCC 5710]